MANEKRLDLVDRKQVFKELRQELQECRKDADEFGGENILWAEGIEFAIDTVKQAKTVDAVEVVRCKDCKHLGFKGLCDGVCNKKMVGIVKPDDFCSYGERREGE